MAQYETQLENEGGHKPAVSFKMQEKTRPCIVLGASREECNPINTVIAASCL